MDNNINNRSEEEKIPTVYINPDGTGTIDFTGCKGYLISSLDFHRRNHGLQQQNIHFAPWFQRPAARRDVHQAITAHQRGEHTGGMSRWKRHVPIRIAPPHKTPARA